MSSNWGDGRSWEEKNWDAVTRQEQQKQDVLVKASSNSERIRQMVRQVDQTGSVARETLGALDEQSEQIKRMHAEVDKIDNNINFADRTIRGMESYWGSFKNYISKPKQQKGPSAGAAEAQRLDGAISEGRKNAAAAVSGIGAAIGGLWGGGGGGGGGGSRAARDDNAAGAAAGGGGQRSKEYGSDWRGQLNKLEDQQDEDLDDLSKMVGQLKSMGQDMGHTLHAQAASLDALSTRTDAVDSRLSKSNLRVKRML